VNELTVLSNLETHNAELIKESKSKEERFRILYEIAKYQIVILDEAERMKSNRLKITGALTSTPNDEEKSN
jgi:hypothetical protein